MFEAYLVLPYSTHEISHFPLESWSLHWGMELETEMGAGDAHCFWNVPAPGSYNGLSYEMIFLQMTSSLCFQFKSYTIDFYSFHGIFLYPHTLLVPSDIDIIYSFALFCNTYKIS